MQSGDAHKRLAGACDCVSSSSSVSEGWDWVEASEALASGTKFKEVAKTLECQDENILM